MTSIVSLVAAAAAAATITAASPTPPERSGQALPLPMGELPSYQHPSQRWTDLEQAAAQGACRAKPTPARSPEPAPASASAARLQHGPASATPPPLEYAVDRRVDGCSVPVLASTRSNPAPTPPPAAAGD